ncbi:hypothetical protein FNU76_12425 [Chitinimonas arctica]|uniref:Uncharacterized protein n=1 Tax=Chitinimonas arctica TaxID=2594795 RepID=A0A516SG41_9NEIS|nr:hypothetical protein [Chitinimonas arctica]QDQ27102.1 hypothetical protein FNU76_12425 [Chitinimonas arctica]
MMISGTPLSVSAGYAAQSTSEDRQSERIREFYDRLRKCDRTLEAIRLEGADFSPGDIGELVDLLKKNRQVQTLELAHNTCGQQAAHILANALAETGLTALSLYRMNVGNQGAEALAKGLQQNNTLHVLELRENQIGARGAHALANALPHSRGLTVLDLSVNQFGPSGISSLAESLIRGCPLVNLTLNHNTCGEIGLRALARVLTYRTPLTSLALIACSLESDGMEEFARGLSRNTNLTSLYCCHNKIGDKGAEALATALESNLHLTQIDLSHNAIGDAGARKLARALPLNTSLAVLGLWSNKIGDDGANALAEGLQLNSTLIDMPALDLRPSFDSSARIAKHILDDIGTLLSRNETLAYARAEAFLEAGRQLANTRLLMAACVQFKRAERTCGAPRFLSTVRREIENARLKIKVADGLVKEGQKQMAKQYFQAAEWYFKAALIVCTDHETALHGMHEIDEIKVRLCTLTPPSFGSR